ncbi:hypothetical protein SRHO_G00009400 [Serrasalmus rhombeus]
MRSFEVRVECVSKTCWVLYVLCGQHIVLVLDEVEKVNMLVEAGNVLKDTHTAVFPLVNPGGSLKREKKQQVID